MRRVVGIGSIAAIVISASLAMAESGLVSDSTSLDNKPVIGTVHSVSSKEIRRMPVRGYEDIVALQSGITEDRQNGVVHLRGGLNSDIDYLVDGFSQRDDFTGRIIEALPFSAMQHLDLTTGVLGVQYGNTTSGVVGVVTPDGSSDGIHGSLEAVSDNFSDANRAYNIYEFSVRGPILPNSNELSFSAAAERRWMGSSRWNWHGKLRWRPSATFLARFGTLGSDDDWRTYPRSYLFNTAHAPRHTLRNRSGWAELVHSPSSRFSYRVSGSWFSTERKSGDGVYFDNIWGYGRPGDGNPQNESTDLFYSWDDLNIDEQGNQIITPIYDSVLTVPMFVDFNQNGAIDDGEKTFLNGQPIEQPFTYSFTRIDSIGTDDEGYTAQFTTAFGDEGHVYDDYEAYEASRVAGRLDVVGRVHNAHTVQAGLEWQRHTLRYYNHMFPNRIYLGAKGGFDDINSYGYDVLGQPTDANPGQNGAKHPVNVGMYLEDRLNIRGLTLKAGVRLDYFDYDAMALRNPANPLDPDGLADQTTNPYPTDEELYEAQQLTETDMTDARTYTLTSPRLGAALPITGQTSLHFSAGRLYQRPVLQNLYVNSDYLEYKVKTGGYFTVLGNAALEPMKTTLFDIGVSHRFGGSAEISVFGFYKTIDNAVTVVNQPAIPNNYATLRNVNGIIAKGIEVGAKLQPYHGITGQVKYTLQDVTGGNLSKTAERNVAWTVSGPPRSTTSDPAYYDQTHKFTGILDMRVGPGQGPKLSDIHPLERAGINLVFRAESGFPYTPLQLYNEVTLGNENPFPAGPTNSRISKATYRLDLKANKEFPIGNMKIDFYFWILNALDRDNMVALYESSGEPGSTSWLETDPGENFVENTTQPTDTSGLTGKQKYRLRENDPANFDVLRQIRFGARVLF